MLPLRFGSSVVRLSRLCAVVFCALLAARANAQEIRGLAKFDARGDAVWGANISLYDSLGRQAGTARSNRKGEFAVRAPSPGTYWLQLSARSLGRTGSPIFVLDSGTTMFYEHIFRHTLTDRVRGEDFSAQSILQGKYADSTSGDIHRGTSAQKVAQVRVRVLALVADAPLHDAEVALVAIDPRFEQVVGARTDSGGNAGWRDLQQSWYRVVGRRVGFEPGGTESFPIVGDADSVEVILRLSSVTVLDEVKVMEQRMTSFGFNLKLMSRFYLGGKELRERNPSSRNVDELIRSLGIAGLSIKTLDMTSYLQFRGQRVRVFILDGARTSESLPLVEPSSVESLMFIPPSEAGAVFGTEASGGVLIINTRNARGR
jgi:hypothetical protein